MNVVGTHGKISRHDKSNSVEELNYLERGGGFLSNGPRF